MSAFICSDRHISTVVVRYCELTGFDDPQRLANNLKLMNVQSVNYRYRNHPPEYFTPCRLEAAVDGLSFPDLVALCECLDYQSCELPDYKNPLLEAITAQFRANVRHGVKSAMWSI